MSGKKKRGRSNKGVTSLWKGMWKFWVVVGVAVIGLAVTQIYLEHKDVRGFQREVEVVDALATDKKYEDAIDKYTELLGETPEGFFAKRFYSPEQQKEHIHYHIGDCYFEISKTENRETNLKSAIRAFTAALDAVGGQKGLSPVGGNTERSGKCIWESS